VTDDEIEQLRRYAKALEEENTRLKAAVQTERGKGAEALARREQRYQTLFDSIDEGFCIIEFLDGPFGSLSDYIHIEANAAYARHAGIPNVVGQKVREMVPHEAEGWVDLYRGVLLTGNPIRFERELVATGRHLELAAFRIEPASERQVAVLFQDITSRKRAEAALQQLNETLEARVAEALAERKVLADIVEGTNAFVQVIDSNYHLIAINSAAAGEFERLFGVRPKVGDNVLKLLDHQPEQLKAVREGWTRALSGQEFVEIAALGKLESNQRHHEMHFNTLRDTAGKQIGAYQFAYDVTDRLKEQERLRIAEEALRQAQKMEAVGQLTGGIAHDFNNMLAVIISSLQLTQRRLGRADFNIHEFIESALRGAQRAANLVSRLLAFSRQQPLSPQRINANQLLRDMEDVLRRTIPENIRIEFIQSGGLWSIHADPHGLENAIVNLAVNARDAMPDGGKLTIETANAYLDDAYSAAHADVPAGQYVMIAVTDTGEGMAPDILGRAFEPFFTTKSVGVGTGLGLSQVYGFLKQSGGHVKIYSEIGFGTTVKLYVPRLTGTPSTDSPALVSSSLATRVGSGQLVLVAEDEDEVRHLAVSILKELGYSVLAASSAPEALAILKRNPDVVLLMTDIVMPGMSGLKLAEEALSLKPDLKVLYATGYARNAMVHNGTLDDGVDLIMKPYSVEALAEKVAKVLGLKATD
jgi:signal transduction histidine kinase/ActR/RegA family two-component response regulator